MKAECPMGHTENLSHYELAERLHNNDFECREEDCTKKYSYEVDNRFWNKHVLGRDTLPYVRSNLLD